MSLPLAPETTTDTYMINGPVTIGDSTTYTTNLRGRTYMKDIPEIENIDSLNYQPRVLLAYNPNYQENWICSPGNSGEILTLVPTGGQLFPMWKQDPCCPFIGTSAVYIQMVDGGNNASSATPLIYSRKTYAENHPFSGTEIYEITTQSPQLILNSNIYTNFSIILEEDFIIGPNASNGNPSPIYYRRWILENIRILGLNNDTQKFNEISDTNIKRRILYREINGNKQVNLDFSFQPDPDIVRYKFNFLLRRIPQDRILSYV